MCVCVLFWTHGSVFWILKCLAKKIKHLFSFLFFFFLLLKYGKIEYIVSIETIKKIVPVGWKSSAYLGGYSKWFFRRRFTSSTRILDYFKTSQWAYWVYQVKTWTHHCYSSKKYYTKRKERLNWAFVLRIGIQKIISALLLIIQKRMYLIQYKLRLKVQHSIKSCGQITVW